MVATLCSTTGTIRQQVIEAAQQRYRDSNNENIHNATQPLNAE